MSKKIVKIILLVIIPLLVATGIGVYSYGRYKSYFFSYYMNDVSYKATEEKVEKYIKFYTSYYDVYFKEDVKDENGKDLFTLACYRWFQVDKDDDDNETKSMQYVFVAYNMNYGNMFYTMYDRNDKVNVFNGYLPYVRITVENATNEDVKEDLQLVYNSDWQIEDYYFVGYTTDEGEATKKYSTGSAINSNTTTKWGKFQSSASYSTSVKVTVDVINGKYSYESLNSNTFNEDDVEAGTYTALVKNFDDFQYNAKRLLDAETGKFNGVELKKGYATDIKEAGYTGYVIGHYMWWEILVAIILTEIITVSTVLVWNSEVEEEKKRQEKLAKSKK